MVYNFTMFCFIMRSTFNAFITSNCITTCSIFSSNISSIFSSKRIFNNIYLIIKVYDTIILLQRTIMHSILSC